jgi:SAM-dependent methyltransferase
VATELAQIVGNLVAFYGFAGRTVVVVGAGGGQLVEYARDTRGVIAVDPDGAGLERLVARAAERGLADKFTFVRGGLLSVKPRGDVVLFEFCLHELPHPARALDHAQQLAPDVLVIDHSPGSPWEWYAAEEDGVEAAWAAVARKPTRRRLDVEACQRFQDYAELEARLALQGPRSHERIGRFRGQRDIAIPMPYRLALL